MIKFHPEIFEKIKSGKKRTTIRRGVKKWTLGHTKLTRIPKNGALIKNTDMEEIMAEVVKIELITIDELNPVHAFAEGFQDVYELKDVLREIYPGIAGDEKLTLVTFELWGGK